MGPDPTYILIRRKFGEGERDTRSGSIEEEPRPHSERTAMGLGGTKPADT